eukprot:CAMPEP_0178998036 /NCGR_PEP_ID=MMETSP0795-20121207/9307_1 /TAXON_ID=88552 /ORGANISM="Amoebophrya sp., Strain Ameob2" /LENGTH=474 /DNA_ID=CAMNT_0020690705 /DNA_START=99 /DNA_END=1523 /DNA_ORIENTATION=-
MPPLGSEQEEKVTLFREVTQAAETRARQYLEMSNWNVEQAINLHMTGALDNMAADHGGGPTAGGNDFIGGTNDTLMGNGAGAAGFIGPVAPNESGPSDQPSGIQRVAERAGSLVSKVFSGIGGFLSSILIPDEEQLPGGGGSSSSSSSSRGGRTGTEFKQMFERAYGSAGPQPTFFEAGSFNEAIQHAKDNMKLLCVYFHCDTAGYTDQFCKDVLKNDLVVPMLAETCVVFPQDIVHRAAYDLARQFNVRSYPFIGLVLPVSSTDYSVLHKLEGQAACDMDAVIAVLTQGADDLSENRARLATAANAYAQDRLLRAEQEREFQEALAKDREADAARQREEEARQKALEEETQAQVARENAAMELEAKRRKLANEVVVVDAATSEPKTKIQVKFPSGQRVNRTFLQSHTLRDLFDWVEASEYTEATAPKVPTKFNLNTSFPTKTLTRSEETLKDAGLVPNVQVLLQDLSEDDDEL